MNRIPAVALAILFALGAAPLSSAGEPSAAESPIPPGTRGVVRTALEGSRVMEIPVEFVGLYENAVGPGHDLYLVRLQGPEAQRVGVAAGMSGSPVYVDGTLVGALSYRMGVLPREPVAGVTPIAEMIAAASTSRSVPAGRSAAVSPIATPLAVSGLTAPVLEGLRPVLEKLGFRVVQGSAADGDRKARPLEAGSPVGIALVRGDVSIAATGTVTRVDGAQVLAFGHPLLGSGRVELPMVNAEVIYTLADEAGSVKLARVGAEVGAILQDRLTAVVGRSGVGARMIPVSLEVRGADREPRRFRFEVAPHPSLAGLLGGAAIANALILDLGFEAEVTARATGEIRVHGVAPLPVEMSFASGNGPHPFLGVSSRIQELVGKLYANPFSEPVIEGITLNVDVVDRRTDYELEDVHLDRGPVRPGQSMDVECVVRGFRGNRETRTLHLRVPADVTPGSRLSLVVGDAPSVTRVLGDVRARELDSARDLAAYVRVLGEVDPQDRLRAVLCRLAAGAISDGRAFTDLPPTAAHLLGTDEGGRPAGTRVTPLAEASDRLDGPVRGATRIRLQVEDGVAGAEAEEDEP